MKTKIYITGWDGEKREYSVSEYVKNRMERFDCGVSEGAFETLQREVDMFRGFLAFLVEFLVEKGDLPIQVLIDVLDPCSDDVTYGEGD